LKTEEDIRKEIKMVRKRLDKSTKLILHYDAESPKPFELIKSGQDFGRSYTLRGVKDLIYSLEQNYSGVLLITPEAKSALGLEKIVPK